MIIQSTLVWLDEKFIPAQIEIIGDKINNIYVYGNKQVDTDYKNDRVIPGMIDIHTHGLAGFDTLTKTEESMIGFKKAYPKEGVTSFLPSVSSASLEDCKEAFHVIAETMKNTEGAEILGCHLEGNFISIRCKAAQPEEYIVKPNTKELQAYIDASEHTLRLICVALENDDNYEVCDYAKERGVRVSCGHSAASYEQVEEGMKHGVVSITHTFNGCIQFHHRGVGVIGAAMNLSDIYAELICDGHHVSFPAMSILGKLKGKDRLIMVSDAVQLKDSTGPIPDNYVIDEEGCFRNLAGNLSGSNMHMNKGLQNLIEKAAFPLETAINAATINPARMLGFDAQKGTITVGKDADIVVLNDNYEVLQTYCKGKTII